MHRIVYLVAAWGAMLGLTASAHATFPGVNGRIAFDTLGENSSDIDTINADSTGRTRLISSPASDSQAVWSPDGTKAAFVSDRSGNFDIYTIDADGRNLLQVTNDPRIDVDPSWSPNGSQLVYVNGEFGDTARFDLYKVNIDGTGRERITAGAPQVADDPDWSPDGSTIAFRADGQIWVLTPDGRGARSLTNAPLINHYAPSWSPDGGSLAFEAIDRPAVARIEVMNADGSNRRQVTAGPNDLAPVFSPDGTRIVFTRSVGFQSDVFTMNRDGSGERPLVQSAGFDVASDWQARPLSPSDFKNRPEFCRSERTRLGGEGFIARYGKNGNGANAFGKCVSEAR